MKMAAQHPAEKLIAENRKARHDYFVLEQLETGISLAGTEVKSLRLGEVNLKDSWVEIENGELFVLGMHISPYEQGNIFNKEPLRTRRLLLHKHEINKIAAAVTATGYTVVPLRVYFHHGLVKMDIGIAKGKKLYDKRADLAEKAAKRDIERAVKTRNR